MVTTHRVGTFDHGDGAVVGRHQRDARTLGFAKGAAHFDVRGLAGERLAKPFTTVGHGLAIGFETQSANDLADDLAEFERGGRAPELVHGDQNP